MTIEDIHKKILYETGFDCYSKCRQTPLPDIRKIFQRACRDFAKKTDGNSYTLKELCDTIGIHRSTFQRNIHEIPVSVYISTHPSIEKAYKLFYPVIENEFSVNKKINELEDRIEELEEKISILQPLQPLN